MRTNPVFTETILRAMKPLRSSGLYDQLAKDVSPPYKDDRFPTLASFEQHVNRTMRKAVTQPQLDLFRRNVIAFKAGLDKRNRRFFKNDKGKRMIMERNLIPCSSTLIAVPDALLEHWAFQIRRHVNLGVFADEANGGSEQGVVYIDGVGDLSNARFPLNHQQTPMPPAFDLLSYMIVVVPFSRIKQQHSNARKRQRENDFIDLTVGSEGVHSSSSLLQLRWFRIIVDEGHELGENPTGSDVTKFINDMAAERRWVMSGTPTTGDEDSVNFTSKGLDQLQRLLLFLRHEKYGSLPEEENGIGNDRKGRGSSNKWQAKTEWVKLVKKPFLRKEHDGRKELYRVLDEVMVMHKKEDIGLPKPIFKQSEVKVPVPSDVQSTIIDVVLGQHEPASICTICNKLGITDFRRQQRISPAFGIRGSILYDSLVAEYLRTDSFQTLVDESQANFVVDNVRRERLELDGRGGAILDGITAPITAATDPARWSDSWVDRRPIKAVVYSNSHNNLLSVAEYLYESFNNENIAEVCVWLLLHCLIYTPVLTDIYLSCISQMMEGKIEHVSVILSKIFPRSHVFLLLTYFTHHSI